MAVLGGEAFSNERGTPVRQPGPAFGPGLQVKQLKTFKLSPFRSAADTAFRIQSLGLRGGGLGHVLETSSRVHGPASESDKRAVERTQQARENSRWSGILVDYPPRPLMARQVDRPTWTTLKARPTLSPGIQRSKNLR